MIYLQISGLTSSASPLAITVDLLDTEGVSLVVTMYSAAGYVVPVLSDVVITACYLFGNVFSLNYSVFIYNRYEQQMC